MKIRYHIDPATDSPHIYNHDVSEDEVEEVLLRPGEDRPGQEGSRVSVGRTTGGRYLRVIYVSDPEPDSVFVITAYELRGKFSRFRLTDIPQSTISAIENERISLGVERAKVLARALKCHPAVLVFPGWDVVAESAA